MDRALRETSGHWRNYRASTLSTGTDGKRDFALKPMNAPGHMLIYDRRPENYHDRPLKTAQFGVVHRN